jgi:DNA primase
MAIRGRLVREWLPEPITYYTTTAGLKLTGRRAWRQTLCVFHDEHNPSLSINVDTGGFCCHACGTKGGDVLDFHRSRYGLAFKEAAQALGAWEDA